MPKLIRGTLADGGRIVDDAWLTVADLAAFEAAPADADLILPLAIWRSAAPKEAGRSGRIGVQLGVTDDPAELATTANLLPLIAIEFPVFSDGRGFSQARLLRERFDFRGELRAVGDVLRDQIYYMLRCGFDAFALRPDKDLEEALTAFRDFSESYQAGFDQPIPLYRRRLAGVVLKEPTA